MSTSITILHGNLGKDPEVFRTDNNFPIATFSLATTRRVSDGNNGKKDVTDWHNIKALGKNAELAERYLHKGKEIIITGHNETRDYNDKDGKKCYITEVVVDRIDFCGSANDNNQNGGQQGQGYNQNQGGGQRQRCNQNQGGGYNQNQGGYQQHGYGEVPYDARR